MTTSQTLERFLAEPMGNKPVTELAGIGKALGKNLNDIGFHTAYQVFGKFLELEKNEVRFKDWLKEQCGANVTQQSDCYQCLNQWCVLYFQ